MCVVDAQNCEQCVLMCHCAEVSLCGSSVLFLLLLLFVYCLVMVRGGGAGGMSNIKPM